VGPQAAGSSGLRLFNRLSNFQERFSIDRGRNPIDVLVRLQTDSVSSEPVATNVGNEQDESVGKECEVPAGLSNESGMR
jgi:hypothetical protein